MKTDRSPTLQQQVQAISRRHVLLSIGSNAAALTALNWLHPTSALAADDYEPLNRFPRMVHEWFVKQVRESGLRHIEQLNRLKTKADAEQYVRDTQARIRQSFGPEPERTPLNPRVTKTIDRDGYRIENVIFDSRPGFPVTANVYIPVGRTGPLPAVVGTCGHSKNGKAAQAYQSFAQGLARLGYVCLIYDPIGQGERLQYVKDDLSSQIGVGVREHLHAGNQQFLVGEFFGMWRAWDGIRALDYLLTRPEVDKQRVGVTGNSGGGTMTTWLCGVEPRWTMAAPSCFVTTFRRNMENELPQDTEQCPPRALALGLDHADFLAAMAPSPIIILAKERDYFDVRGSEETYQQLRRLYSLLDAEDNVALFVGPTGHGYSQENREAMYSWFNRASGLASDDANQEFEGVLTAQLDLAFSAEPKLTIEKDETLWCTEKGQVGLIDGTRTVFEFTREKSKQLASDRKSLSGAALRRAVVDVLKLPAKHEDVPDYRNWRYLGSRGYPTKFAMAYTVDTEPGIHTIVYRLTNKSWHSRPPRAGKRAILYVPHLSSDNELRDEPLIREVMQAEPNSPVFTCDVRGIGESIPDTCNPGSFHTAYGNDYFYAIHSLMLDRPYLGQKTFDVLRVLDWLASLGHTDIHLVGRGWGALAATFAAVISDQVKQVTLKNALTSYADIAESEHYNWPLSALLPNVLAQVDLPDCYSELNSKNLRRIDSWGAEPPGK
ncbi:Acetyl xylan esterase (AXE1) [Symmachiella macrocystis]|uniref:Acetyl xylan esterase (AXE1) n=1 Tax=Symmachiella macrocystis TaxID=2527985 RepID=A0A5C6BL73_9PLAN|nr:acetylxylan esterase [Symmachiella macrocystis]TWU12106.1 Acetyl xylan esterase (AXE1) [Symmachiella macrocystis]